MQGLTKKNRLINPKDVKMLKQTRKRRQSGGGLWDSFLKQIGYRNKTNANEIEGAAANFRELQNEIKTQVDKLNSLFGKVMPLLEKCQTTIQTSQQTSTELAAAVAANNAEIAPSGMNNVQNPRPTAPIGAGVINERDDTDEIDDMYNMNRRPRPPGGLGLGNPPPPNTDLIGGSNCMSSKKKQRKPRRKKTLKIPSESS
jgi:hypothetical protein